MTADEEREGPFSALFSLNLVYKKMKVADETSLGGRIAESETHSPQQNHAGLRAADDFWTCGDEKTASFAEAMRDELRDTDVTPSQLKRILSSPC
jgi:hypothetical protein